MNAGRREGQSVVEFALVLPLLLILTFGIVDFSIALYDKAVVTNASREGARAGIVYQYPAPTFSALTSSITTVVNNYCSSYLITFGAPTTPAVTVTGSGAHGTNLTVTVQYHYTFAIISHLVPSLTNPTLTATTIMRME